jgi:hypothetical protein
MADACPQSNFSIIGTIALCGQRGMKTVRDVSVEGGIELVISKNG